MRCGDVYKIEGLIKAGKTPDEVCHLFRNSYPADEVLKFISVEKPKRKRRTKAEMAAARAAGAVDDNKSGIDM